MKRIQIILSVIIILIPVFRESAAYVQASLEKLLTALFITVDTDILHAETIHVHPFLLSDLWLR